MGPALPRDAQRWLVDFTTARLGRIGRLWLTSPGYAARVARARDPRLFQPGVSRLEKSSPERKPRATTSKPPRAHEHAPIAREQQGVDPTRRRLAQSNAGTSSPNAGARMAAIRTRKRLSARSARKSRISRDAARGDLLSVLANAGSRHDPPSSDQNSPAGNRPANVVAFSCGRQRERGSEATRRPTKPDSCNAELASVLCC
jgi:hypothetical protein